MRWENLSKAKSEMDALHMIQADNDKQAIDRIISTATNFSLDIVVEVSQIVAERNSGNKQNKNYFFVVLFHTFHFFFCLRSSPNASASVWFLPTVVI
jgi:hypothetical protein